jgi:uroporphyrinogen-III synthase
MNKTNILLTREYNDNLSLAYKLRSYDYKPIINPLLKIEINDITNQVKHIENKIIITTSKNSIKSLSRTHINKENIIITVGNKSTLIAKKHGFKNVITANNSAESVLNLIIEKFPESKINKFVYLSGDHITIDISDELNKKGYECNRVIAYKSIAQVEINKDLEQIILRNELNYAIFYSQRTARIFAQALRNLMHKNDFNKINLNNCLSLVLSYKIYQPLVEFNCKYIIIDTDTDIVNLINQKQRNNE